MNCGAAEARNRGIEIARGKYLCFVDADDYIESGFLRHFYDAFQADDCDFVRRHGTSTLPADIRTCANPLTDLQLLCNNSSNWIRSPEICFCSVGENETG